MEKNHIIEAFKYLGLITYIGVLMTTNIVLGYYLGMYIQSLTGSLLLFIMSIFLGIGSGFLAVYQLIKKLL